MDTTHRDRSFPRLLLLLVAVALLGTACGTITPESAPPYPRLPGPVLGDVSLVGLQVEDIRYAGTSRGVGGGSSRVYTPSPSGGAGTWSTVDTTVTTTTHHMERVQTDAVRDALRIALENHGVVERFTPDARVRIEGRRIEGGASTGAGKVLWNVVNAVSLLGIVPGLPFLGEQEATVELRVYDDDRLVRTYTGEGSAAWSKNGWGIAIVLNQYRVRTLGAATAVAARKAVLALIQDPPGLASAAR